MTEKYKSCRRREFSLEEKTSLGRLSPAAMAELQPLFNFRHNLEADPYMPFSYINS